MSLNVLFSSRPLVSLVPLVLVLYDDGVFGSNLFFAINHRAEWTIAGTFDHVFYRQLSRIREDVSDLADPSGIALPGYKKSRPLNTIPLSRVLSPKYRPLPLLLSIFTTPNV